MSEFVIKNLRSADQSSTSKWIFSHLSRHFWLFLVMVIGAVGNAVLAASVPIMIGRAFDAVLMTPADLRVVGLAALGIILSQAGRAILQLGRNFSSGVIGERLERDMREELFVSLLGKGTNFHDMQPVGDTMARATNDVREVNMMMNPGINLVVGSTAFLMMPLILSPRINPLLILAPAFFLVTFVLALIRYLGVLSPISDQVRQSFGHMNSRLAEAIDGVEMVKATAQEPQETARFRENARIYRDSVVKQGKVEARFLPMLLLGVTQAIGFTLSLLLYREGAVALGDVIAYMGLLSLLGFPTFIALMAYSRLSLGWAGARRILSLLNSEVTLDENIDGYRADVVGAIRFEDVTFGYEANVNVPVLESTAVLQNVSFTVKPGQTIAVVGQTGSGKSTLAKLINRTYDVGDGNGRILIDDVDVRDWSLEALRQQISIIEQDIFLFSRTIAENIAFGCVGAPREAVIAAAKSAQAHEFVLGFQDGYDTIVGERGVTLSGGQRQRLALARAFLTDPHILILDDSTSAVDSATEDQIQKAIQVAAANRTTILITHRLSQIRWADQVVVLRKGHVEATGDHKTLMQKSPAYRRIFEQYEALDA